MILFFLFWLIDGLKKIRNKNILKQDFFSTSIGLSYVIPYKKNLS